MTKNPKLDNQLDIFLKSAIEALDIAKEITKDIDISESSLKDDGSLLTEYDLKVEKEIYNILSKTDADIVTEEILGRENNKEFCWFVDPIDGTTSFSKGIPLFGTIIGLTQKENPIMGFIELPKFNQRFFSVSGKGCYKNNSLIKASNCDDLSKAMISYGSPQRFIKENLINQLNEIDKIAWDSRGFSDCFGYSLAFNGSIDLYIEVDLNPWETIALESLSKESGAGFAEQPSINGKKNIIFGSQKLIPEIIEILGGNWKIK
ncbi:MAG: inositol monophosphatase [SAR202 cluster bacterium]|nr:inositol monophosphatase [SAR202 cluster bacterium]